MKLSSFLLLLGISLGPGHALAQSTTNDGTIELELNLASDTTDGTCQVVFFGRNGLDEGISEVTWRLAVFDDQGIFQTLLSLPMGALSVGKRRVVQYNLPTSCAKLSEIIVNDVASCKLAEAPDNSEVCLTNLAVSSKSTVAFGI